VVRAKSRPKIFCNFSAVALFSVKVLEKGVDFMFAEALIKKERRPLATSL
jgi:hypothetical protein